MIRGPRRTNTPLGSVITPTGNTVFEKVSSAIYQRYNKMQLENRFPFLRGYSQESENITENFRPYYEQYVKNVSTPEMACSLRTAVLLKVFCEGLKPKRMLDLGSGFSSFVLRSYAASHYDVDVYSVDDSSEWLDHTRAYLASHNLSTERLILWNQFKRHSSGSFDLVFHDLGNMNLRKGSLHLVLKMVEGEGVVLLDDMHKTSYAQCVRNCLSHYSCRYFDLKPYTLDEFRRYCGLATDMKISRGSG